MTEPSRPALRWHGGKWRLAPWIIGHFPSHRTYVEPFGGAASVLIRKPRAYAEIYNDLDDEVVDLFRVLRDPDRAAALEQLLRLTPFARCEFRSAYEPTDDVVERCRRLIIRSFMGFGSNAHASAEKGHRSTGFRASSSRSGTTPAIDWANYPAAMAALVERMQGVVIESRPAIEVMAQHDRAETLHYVDPPYMHETRAQGNKYDLGWRMYRYEMTNDQHAQLLEYLRSVQGMVVLSGYPAPLYDDMLFDWRRVEKETFADGARQRLEVLWINPRAALALDRMSAAHAQGSGTPLFGQAGGAA
ncbi:DNA adenine methylase [Rhizobium lentis]|uniref:DNA adenine methylase n=1 Tax=Rhizobium lentis TaxID=1138194 RepID=UPI001C83314A|nr:DNA adenine methylase [Rhizobium lentis]MBX5112704.1 DNA adenine methylase [Rhizobium lentis]